MLDFTNRVALITGAGHGLGAAYAKWLARRGARVVVNNRTHPNQPSSARAVVEEILAAGGDAVADEHNVEDDGAGEAMVALARRAFGRVDIIVANAAIPATARVENTGPDLYRKAMEINFYGSVSPILAALPEMRQRDYGRIIVTTSAAALFGGFQHTAYAASKTALFGFMRSLAAELRKTNVRINAISPYALTKMSGDVIDKELSELMAPEQVAPVVGWLASEACDRSGIILSAGAGRVRRACMVESSSSPVSGKGEMDFDVLDDLSGASETINSRWSSTALIPELISRNQSK